MGRVWDDPFDATDVAILGILQRDGRASVSSMARDLGLAESTVRSRTHKILASGLVSIVATGDPLKLGVPVDAISFVRVAPNQADDVADALAQLREIRYVGVTLGATTLVVESLHSDTDALHTFLARTLPAVKGVKEVDSRQIIDIRKSVWDWQSWLKDTLDPDARTDAEEAP